MSSSSTDAAGAGAGAPAVPKPGSTSERRDRLPELGENEIPRPAAARSLWRTFELGYRVEPRLLVTSLVVDAPDDAARRGHRGLAHAAHRRHPRPATARRILVAAVGLAASATLTWYLTVVNARVGRKFRDRIAMAHGGPHRPPPGGRARPSSTRSGPSTSTACRSCATSRSRSTTSSRRSSRTSGWCSGSSSRPCCWRRSTRRSCCCWPPASRRWRRRCGGPASSGRVQERAAPHDRLARHLFVLATTAPPAKEVRLSGTAADLAAPPRGAGGVAAADRRPPAGASAAWSAAAWALFGLAYALGIVWVARGLDRPVGRRRARRRRRPAARRSTSPRPSASSASSAASGSTRRCG